MRRFLFLLGIAIIFGMYMDHQSKAKAKAAAKAEAAALSTAVLSVQAASALGYTAAQQAAIAGQAAVTGQAASKSSDPISKTFNALERVRESEKARAKAVDDGF
jgi:hypothetical protein